MRTSEGSQMPSKGISNRLVIGQFLAYFLIFKYSKKVPETHRFDRFQELLVEISGIEPLTS